MTATRAGTITLVVAIALGWGSASAAGFQDPLALPAQASELASRSMLLAVTRAGARLIAVGQRGHVIVSDDAGASWKQASVPVSSDLTAVFFVTDQVGWAVGHDGVVLGSRDGGRSWALQLDGQRANARLVEYLQGRAQADPRSTELQGLLTEARRYQEQGPDKPFLDVWFADENDGFVVGAYNLVFRTSDGGTSWEPWFDRTENPKLLNLYAIRPAGGDLFVVGEGGLVLKLEPQARRFRAQPTPYKGSFFGVIGGKDVVLAFGLRGSVYSSGDRGKTWNKEASGLPAAIVAATPLPGGRVLLADAGGRVAVSDEAGRGFKVLPLKQAMPLAGIADAGNGRLALVGPGGVAVTEPTTR
jgi:photosystem II stability/assembly factor-like uncharacterized protein